MNGKINYGSYEKTKAIRMPINLDVIKKIKSDLRSIGINKVFNYDLDSNKASVLLHEIVNTWIREKHPKLAETRLKEKQPLPYLTTSWFDDPSIPACLDLVIDHIYDIDNDPTEYGYSRELLGSEQKQIEAIGIFDGFDLSKLRLVEYQWKAMDPPSNCYDGAERLRAFMQPSSIVVPTPNSVSADILKNLDPKGLISLFGTDKFYVDSDIGSVRWVYFNPDSNAGGQFVENNLTFDQIVEVAENYPQSEFFDQLGSIARQYLIDIDTDGFAYEARDHLTAPCQVTGMSVASMTALVEIARGSV